MSYVGDYIYSWPRRGSDQQFISFRDGTRHSSSSFAVGCTYIVRRIDMTSDRNAEPIDRNPDSVYSIT